MGSISFTPTTPDVTLNDNGEVDGGSPPHPATAPNRLQNFPVITSAKLRTRRIGGHSRKGTLIKGTLNSEADKTYNVRFFGSPEADNPPNPPYTITGYGENKTFLGQMSVSTNSNGDATFTFSTKKKVPKGQVVSGSPKVARYQEYRARELVLE